MPPRPRRGPHHDCRPPADAVEVERLLMNGRWIPDDGKPGIAFSGRGPTNTPFAWSTDCACRSDLCPLRLAMNRTCERFHAANGKRVPKVKK